MARLAMIGAVALAAAAAALLLTWAHLSPRRAPRAEPVPSLQHVRSGDSRNRRRFQLEQVALWSLRLLALLAALTGIALDRLGNGAPERSTLVLVDEGGWGQAQQLTGVAGRLGFLDGRPHREGGVPWNVERALRECSASAPDCLVRAARESERKLVFVGPFDGGWASALAQLGRGFAFVRSPAQAQTPVPSSKPSEKEAAKIRIRLSSQNGAARLWAAAMAADPSVSLVGQGAPADLEVLGPDARPDVYPLPSFIALDGESQSSGAHPAVEARRSLGALLADPFDLAAGMSGLGARDSLQLAPDPRFQSLAGLQLVASADRPVAIAAASEEDLGRWLHEGALTELARLALDALLHRPVALHSAPAGGVLGWKSDSGVPAAVGALDVAPGNYLRTDGRVSLQLQRAKQRDSAALDDAALVKLGGAPLASSVRPRLPSATLLLCAALLFWLLGSAIAWRAWLALPAAVLVAALLALWIADVARERAVEIAAVARASTKAAAALAGTLQRAGANVKLVQRFDCQRESALEPCLPLASVALSEELAASEPADAVVFDVSKPRIDLLSVRSPGEIPLGSGAELWATVRARRSRGAEVELIARPSSAAPVRASFKPESDDEVRLVHLAVAPLTAGISFVAVEARNKDSAASEDARVIALATRAKPLQRLVLAASPSWEARAAENALALLGAAPPPSETRVGASALLARGTPRSDPKTLLANAAARGDLDTLILVGFTRADLAGAGAAGLRKFLESGGAVLLLGGIESSADAASALGWPAAAHPAAGSAIELHGSLEDRGEEIRFRGYPPASGAELPPGANVLARLGAKGAAEKPWVVGRALGRGRLAVVTAPELWRLSPPSGAGESYREVFSRALGWVEAARADKGAMVLSEDWQSLRFADGSERALSDARAGEPQIDPLLPETLTAVLRARLRAAAARRTHPFLEVEGGEELAAIWKRLPAPGLAAIQLRLRRDDRIFMFFALLFAVEAWLRRRKNGALVAR